MWQCSASPCWQRPAKGVEHRVDATSKGLPEWVARRSVKGAAMALQKYRPEWRSSTTGQLPEVPNTCEKCRATLGRSCSQCFGQPQVGPARARLPAILSQMGLSLDFTVASNRVGARRAPLKKLIRMVSYHFALQIHPKMRRYFPSQRKETFAGRHDTYRDELLGEVTRIKRLVPTQRGASRTCPALRDRVDLYCELVLA